LEIGKIERVLINHSDSEVGIPPMNAKFPLWHIYAIKVTLLGFKEIPYFIHWIEDPSS
jgi:hypothetical protein